MKKKYLPIIALVTGFIWAFITAGVYSMLFALLPLLAFAFGYFTTWRWGLLNGFLLFLGYTFASPRLLDPFQYYYAFISGGFAILLIGALAPIVRNSIRKLGSIAVLVLLAAVVAWCAYQTLPRYNFYYQVIIHSSEDIENLELYLPVGTVSGEIYDELYDNPLRVPGRLTENYTKELVDMEHGRMLKLTVSELMEEGPRGYPYTLNIIFTQENPPHELMYLVPRYDALPVNRVTREKFLLLFPLSTTKEIEKFKAPIMVKSDIDADFELRLENRTGKGEAVNFSYSKSNTYTELIRYEGSTSDEWLLVPVEVTDRLSIRGVGD